MAEQSVSSGRPRFAAVIRTRNPYVLFEVTTNDAYVINLRYLSRNKGTNSSGESEVLNFTNRNEIPIIPEEYHRLIVLCAGKIVAGELKNLRDSDGNLRYPSMQAAYEFFASEYAVHLEKEKEIATRRSISRNLQAFSFAGAEYNGLYW